MIPACVACMESGGDIVVLGRDPPVGSNAFARPKSSTFTVPSGRTLMLAGLRSRWDDALLVGGFERLCDLSGDRQGLVERYRAAADTVRERRPGDQLPQ